MTMKRLFPRGRTVVIGIPFAWLLVFFFAPFLIVLKYSFSEMGLVSAHDIVSVSDGAVRLVAKYSNYLLIATDGWYFKAFASSIQYAAITTASCLLIGYPFSYFMARSRPASQPALLMMVMLPFWTSFLLRVYAWKGLLDERGWVATALTTLHIDSLLIWAGMISSPGVYLHTSFSLVVGMTYTYLPFMILPLYSNLAKLDLRLLEAAADLGATPWLTFWKVTVPLSRAGIVAGSMLVFIPSIGEYVIPELLGGPQTLMIARVIWDEFFTNNDWPMAASVAVVLVLLIVVPLAVFNKYQQQAQELKS